jgi:hypothetical protein
VSAQPTPAARLSGEGVFAAMAEYAWTPAAEEELTERLARLGECSP